MSTFKALVFYQLLQYHQNFMPEIVGEIHFQFTLSILCSLKHPFFEKKRKNAESGGKVDAANGWIVAVSEREHSFILVLFIVKKTQLFSFFYRSVAF